MLIVKRRCAWYNKCMKESSKKFNLRYSLIQGSYWALSGIIFGFTAVYLQGKQYTNYDIGIIFALGNIVGFIAQPLVAGHIDRTRQRTLLRCILIAAALSLALMISVLFMPTAFKLACNSPKPLPDSGIIDNCCSTL